jgi:endoglucanase
MRYLEALHVGLIGWGLDSNYGKLVKDHTKYEPTDYSSFTGCTKTPSESGGGRLIANYPND